MTQVYTVTPADRRVYRRILIPALIEAMIMVFFSLADTVMLGNTPNSALNLAAVSLVTAPIQFFVNVVAAYTIGVTTAVAYYSGQGDSPRRSAAVRQSLLIVAGISLTVTLLSLCFAPQIAALVGVKGDMLALAIPYFRLIMAALPAQMLTTCITAALRGIGETQVPMLYNLLSGILKLGLNALLIYGAFGLPVLGVQGAAWATAISQGVAFLAAAAYILLSPSPIRLDLRQSFLPTREVIGRISRVGITTSLEQMLLQGGNMISTRMFATMSVDAVAALNVATSVESVVWKASGASQIASTQMSSRSLGEGHPERARARTDMILRSALTISAVAAVVMFFLRAPIARLYSPDEAVWQAAQAAIIPVCPTVLAVAVHLVLSGHLRAMGDSKYSLYASLISLWSCRVVLSLALVQFGFMSPVIARGCIMLDQFVRAAVVYARYRKRGRMERT